MATNAELLQRLAERLRPEDPSGCLEELRRSPTFSGDISWLARLFEAADFLPMPEVPESLHERLVSSFDQVMGPRAARIERAVLLRDTRESQPLAGLRGTSVRETEQWSLVYSAPSGELVIDLVASPERQLQAFAHLLPRSPGYVPFEVTGKPGASPITGDEQNTFELGDLGPGSHTFVLESDDFAIEWTVEIHP